MEGFLEINISWNENSNSLSMTQTRLIKRILAAMDMEDCNLKYTPGEKDSLCKDIDGDPCHKNWDYRFFV